MIHMRLYYLVFSKFRPNSEGKAQTCLWAEFTSWASDLGVLRRTKQFSNTSCTKNFQVSLAFLAFKNVSSTIFGAIKNVFSTIFGAND